jgi:glycosyltransferase involved in cell wall biosynthesis
MSTAAAGAAFSVVVPAYNEGAGIAACLDRLTAYLDRSGLAWEVIVADDGSADDTGRVVLERAGRDARIRLVPCPRRGKGAAVRSGMLAARGAWRMFADADLSMPPDNIDRFLASLGDRAAVPHIVIASREAPGARRFGEPAWRHLLGRLFNLAVRALAVPGVRDTQCGFKLLSAEAVAAVFPHMRVNGFAFDVELLFLARRAGVEVREVGIDWYCRRDSRVGVARGAAAFADIVRVRWNGWLGRYRGVPPAALWVPARLDGVA